MGVFSSTQANAYADKIKVVYDYLDEIRKVADRLTPVEDLTSFQTQISELHARLDLLVEASSLIVEMSPAGEAILTGTIFSIRALLGIEDIPDDLVTQAELDAAIAAAGLGNGSGLGGLQNSINEINLLIDQLDQYRVVQQSTIEGLQLSYQNVAAGLETNQTNISSALQRLTVQEQYAALVDQRFDSISQELISTTQGLQGANNIISGHTASISTALNSINIQSQSIDALSSSFNNLQTGQGAISTAIDEMSTSIQGLGADIIAQSNRTTSLKSAIGGSANLLPNADFAVEANGWRIVVAQEDWADTLLTTNTFNMPEEVNCLEVLGEPSPLGQIVVESPAVLLEAGNHYIISGYPCVDNGTVALSYKAFNNADQVVGQGTCPATFNVTTNANFSAYTRTWLKFLSPAGATKLRLYLTVVGDGDWIVRGALFRPMVEKAWIDQAGPSVWTPNIGGSAQVLAEAVDTLTTDVETIGGLVTAQAGAITTLTASIAGKADASAVNSLTAKVSSIEGLYNVNVIPNAGMKTEARGWSTSWDPVAGPPYHTFGRNHLGSSYQASGTNNFGIGYTGTMTGSGTGQYYAVDNKAVRIPLLPGTEYIFSAYLAKTASAVGVMTGLTFYNDLNQSLGAVELYHSTIGYTGGTSRSNWIRKHEKFTTPAGAAYAVQVFRLQSQGGVSVNPSGWFMEAMLERAVPGQTLPSAFNFGSSTAWAEWNLTLNVNGAISGISYAADGSSSAFEVDADSFRVKSARTNRYLSWENGHLWNKGTDYSVILGQDMTPEADVIMWIGPNPASPQTALKEDAALYINEDGTSVFRGVVNQSLITGSAFELGSTRIHVGGGRLAPFTLREFSYKGQTDGSTNFSATVTLDGFQSPDVGTGYHHKRFSRKKADVVLNCIMHGDGSGNENVFIEVQYDGGTWTTITSRSGINVDYRGAFTFLIRYTTLETWNTVAFRARTNNGNTICLAFSATVDNTFESGNTAGSNSGMSSTTGGGGSPPSGGGGGGGGGSDPFCVDYDSVLPDGRLVRELQVGDLVECVDMATMVRGMFPLLAMSFGEEDCYRVTTSSGEVIQSASTPMDMRDGSVVRTPDLAGLDLLHHSGRFETASIQFMGLRKVCKPDLGNRMFFAGVRTDSTIATHNIRMKPEDGML